MKSTTAEKNTSPRVLRLPRPLPGTEQTERLIERYLVEQRAKIIDALAVCESTREVDFAIALLCSGDKDGAFVELCKPDEPALAKGRGITVCAQYGLTLPSLKNIRIDFAIFGRLTLAVEVDGHDGHKTKAQRSADAARDRELSAMGWRPIRITGSELYADPQARADEVFRLLGLTPGVAPPAPVSKALVGPSMKVGSSDLIEQIKAAEARGDVEEQNRLLMLSFERRREQLRRQGGLL